MSPVGAVEIRNQFSERRQQDHILGKQLRTRQHSHHLKTLPVHPDAAPDHRRIAVEFSPPQRVAQQHRLRLALHEASPQRRPQPDRRKKIVGDHSAIHLFRLALARDLERVVTPRRNLLERTRPRPVQIIRKRDRQMRKTWMRLPDLHQAFSMRERQRPQQRRVHRAEDRRIRPNPQPQRQHRRRGESRILQQGPQRIPHKLVTMTHFSKKLGTAYSVPRSAFCDAWTERAVPNFSQQGACAT